MSDVRGHAAFHVQHHAHGTGTRADRRNMLHESMRHLSARDVARHAAKNPSIVPADARLNAAFVNDGDGGFRATASVKDVLDYGDARLKRVRRKINEKQVTFNTYVVHLPKTMCIEVPDYYPRLNPDGTPRVDADGKVLSRSRWVARDFDEAMRYLREAVGYLSQEVIPGGHDAIHGWATNLDESTPHVQLMADPLALDPKAPASAPDALRTEQSQAFMAHREVKDENGRQISGAVKMRGYQEGLREHTVALGYPVEAEVGERHGQELPPAEFKEAEDNLAEVRARSTRNAVDHVRLNDWDARLIERQRDLEDRETAQKERDSSLDAREREILAVRRVAVEDGKTEGFRAGLAAGESQAQQQLEAAVLAAQAAQRQAEEERREAELEKTEAQAQWNRYAEAATEFETMNVELRPLHERWRQANPGTEVGNRAAQSLAKHTIRQEHAASLRKKVEPAEHPSHQPGG